LNKVELLIHLKIVYHLDFVGKCLIRYEVDE